METLLRNTTCSKGHTHPPWNTTGVLRVEKCESICGFCQKETKTAANLRKHVAIHIKNERLNLTIAEGSSGRGRLEMPQTFERESSSGSRLSYFSDETDASSSARRNNGLARVRSNQGSSADPFSPSAVLMSMHQPHSQSGISRSYPSSSTSTPTSQGLTSSNHQSVYSYPYSTPTTTSISQSSQPPSQVYSALDVHYPSPEKDLFRVLREHNISTKTAWTVIPASEGTRVLELCKSLSVAQEVRGSSLATAPVPCYHRETLYDEEWQAHMRDVHGVFFLWPETWMKRIEVVDLEAYGGDIGGINNLMME
ncbi:hypothetical protein HYALB_00011904 [Hymenoscyphus albidus]|uniref:Uncharacterized protein n=1 Tax=Hymenoscyphus albidus TaxID=595503 RepID=A0A9N9LQ21_9HELO|nr:hypothetical protein HYALB_00011904 [Hymenoscyphus albidus]